MELYASLRTDIIYYYFNWLKKRIKDGYFDIRIDDKNVNRYHFEDFEKVYFFSKNPSKLIKDKKSLNVLKKLNTKYELILEISPCEKLFEESLEANKYEFLEVFKKSSQKAEISSLNIAFSYSPIFFTSFTDLRWHIAKFKFFCKALNGYTRKVYISFNTNSKIKNGEYDIIDLTDEEKQECINIFSEIAKSNNMKLLLKPNITDDINVNMNNGVVDISCNNMCKHHCLYCPYNWESLSKINKKHIQHLYTSSTIIGIVDEDKDKIHEINIKNYTST